MIFGRELWTNNNRFGKAMEKYLCFTNRNCKVRAKFGPTSDA